MSVKRIDELPFGAHMQMDGAVRFRIWAPAHERISLQLDAGVAQPMLPFDQGWHELVTFDAKVGTRYRFVLPDGTRVPDPASRFQPEDVHGPSEVIDPTHYAWQDETWQGRVWDDIVLYELHIGTFTAAGTFRAAIERLDHLVELGITAIEIMPVAEFPGSRNWGYDGVLLFAPDSSYGHPDDFKALIDAAHGRGLAVILDVVYNHFGPDGNYLASYAPQFFNAARQTPWGAALNYDAGQSQAVREFMIRNALYWLREFNLDGLRLDAVHAIVDSSDKPLPVELAERARTTITDRPIHLLVENEHNQASLLRRDTTTPLLYTAQWNDDVHHVLHTAVTHEGSGYYQDYLDDTHKLGHALAEGFAFQGEFMPFRGATRGEPSTQLPPSAFVSFIQNHDQIGNRAFGERLTALTTPEALRAITTIYLLLPQIPMLFMGEEWGTRTPFTFFCDFQGDLAEAVRRGRREEFARFPEFRDPDARERIPDPLAVATFTAAKLDWNELQQPLHAAWLQWYRKLLQQRRRDIVPLIKQIAHAGHFEVPTPGAVQVTWQAGTQVLNLQANLSQQPLIFAAVSNARLIWQEGSITESTFAPWSVRWSIVEQ